MVSAKEQTITFPSLNKGVYSLQIIL